MSDCIYNNLIMIVLFLAAPFAAGGSARLECPNIGGAGCHAVIQRPRASFGTSRRFLCIVLVHILRFPGGWLSSRGSHINIYLLTLFTAWVSTFLSAITTLHSSIAPCSKLAIIAGLMPRPSVWHPAAFATLLTPIVPDPFAFKGTPLSVGWVIATFCFSNTTATTVANWRHGN